VTKQRLLVVYIHGFVGSEASFHSFPFHVHMKLKERLAATHAIHSKIYPRYKTYKAFHLATENLSHWLSAHEDSNTDVILVGHSMGGLLAEEVVLLVCKGHQVM
jgi:pimeloyl-ACP methyl ester carboxylesterase